MMERAQAAALMKALSGDAPGVFITFELIKKVGDLQAAAFISQAAWLSANATHDGWFFLDQKGDGVATKDGIYKTMGSWQQGLGITEHAQKAIRTLLLKNGWLCERPSVSGMRRGEKSVGNEDKAFLFTQRQGTPPRLHYYVDLPRYLKFLASDGPAKSEKRDSRPDDPANPSNPQQGVDSKDNPENTDLKPEDSAGSQVVDCKDNRENADLKLRNHEFETVDSQIQSKQSRGFVYKTESKVKSGNIITTTTPNPSAVASHAAATPPETESGGGGEIDLLVKEMLEAAYWQQCLIEPPRNLPGWKKSLRERFEAGRYSDDDHDTHKRWKRFQEAQAQAKFLAQEVALAAKAEDKAISESGSVGRGLVGKKLRLPSGSVVVVGQVGVMLGGKVMPLVVLNQMVRSGEATIVEGDEAEAA